jgi:Carboxypeptidase regulatory-like domain
LRVLDCVADGESPADRWTEGLKIVAVNSTKTQSWTKSRGPVRAFPLGASTLFWLTLWVLLFGLPAWVSAQEQSPVGHRAGNAASDAPGKGASAGEQQTDAKTSGNISGTVVYQTGAPIAGARVKLTRDDQSPSQEVLTGDEGQFLFTDVAPGPFHITVTGEGFETQSSSGVLHSGDTFFVPQIVLSLATVVTEVRVLPPKEVAEAQIKEQEKQRVLGVIPNFYVSYEPNAVALTPKQKFELAWKSSVDPVTFVGIAFIAGFQQAGDQYWEYGQGMEGYGKRYGAFYGNVVAGTFLGDAVMPSLLKQDPRYFYRGTGSKKSRLLHSLGAPFVCPGDNGRQQLNYSYLTGSFAAGAISTLYYPTNNHSVAGLAVENAFVRIAENSISSVAQEFFVRKLTPHHHSAPPSSQP